MLFLFSKCYQSTGETGIYSNNSYAKQRVASAILEVLTCVGNMKVEELCLSVSWRKRNFVKVSLVKGRLSTI